MTKPLCLTLYKSRILPIIDYADAVYSGAAQEALNGLQLIQNKACRIILQAGKLDSTEDMHIELGLTRAN